MKGVGRERGGPIERSSSQRGFTLLEALVAFAIMAIAFTALLQAFGTGLGGLDRAERHALAALQARSKLAEVGVLIPLEAGRSEGELPEGGRWSVEIEAQEALGRVGPARRKILPYRIVVEIRDERGGGPVRLETLRLGEEP